ncbi:MAG: aminotransferase class V-fold PLP-dependent enzyme [Bacteroidetes bacterium]|nr:aminotransferase class V-fold PLP-dependent enzyme [Bacteroidota bacterium]MBS1540608.1 aminotransferase class V-fold PLP-dependent enzyme [Bacteroidota bacterium]
MKNLPHQRKKFSLPAQSVYLNCAYMSPLLKSVEKAGIQGLLSKRNPSFLSSGDFFTGADELRSEFAQLINAKNKNQIAIIPSASYGLANAAKNIKLKRGENLIVAAEQFPSNVYPWMNLSKESGASIKTIHPPSFLEDRGKIWNEKILDSIDSATRLVALGHVHWADGTKFDLMKIRKRTREVGALLVIDGTQSVGALPFDVRTIQPDALICGGYKWLLGPYAIGLAYYGNYFDQGIPIEENWINRKNSEDFSGLVTYEANYQPGALRYDVGERSNFILVPMMTAALKQINQWTPGRIQEYCQKISARPITRLREAGYWIEREEQRGHHLFGIRLPQQKSIREVRAKLKENKIAVSVRGEALRVSPYLYNSEKDLMKLVETLIF